MSVAVLGRVLSFVGDKIRETIRRGLASPVAAQGYAPGMGVEGIGRAFGIDAATACRFAA
jgi:hypothetical protein